MANLAIKGHATRGREVIEILEMLGGINTKKHYGDNAKAVYYINTVQKNKIWCDNMYNLADYIILTLEEFLEKFPYKVGDKVQATIGGSVYVIEQMQWENNQVVYTACNLYWKNCKHIVTSKDLQPYKEETLEATEEFYNKYCVNCGSQRCTAEGEWLEGCAHYKEETMKGKIESFEILESHCADEVKIEFNPSKFKIVERENGYYIVRKKTQYPKTLEECCKIINTLPHTRNGVSGYASGKLWALQKLLICRDAYWKIAGEWKPDFTNFDEERFGIYTQGDKIVLESYGGGNVNVTLTFPTEESIAHFFENFKDLIEQCKELL